MIIMKMIISYVCFILILIVILTFLFLGMSSGWQGFPLDTMFDNIRDGWMCFMGNNPEDFTRYDSAYTNCRYSSLLVLGYVFSNVIVLECIGRVLQSNNIILARSMAAAVFLSFLALGIFDSAINIIDVVAIIILLIGMEVYGHDPEPDVEAVTNFSP